MCKTSVKLWHLKNDAESCLPAPSSRLAGKGKSLHFAKMTFPRRR
jgi:hypothetical protein